MNTQTIRVTYPKIQAVFFGFANVCAKVDFDPFLKAFTALTRVSAQDTETFLFGAKEDGKRYGDMYASFDLGEIGPTKFFHEFSVSLRCERRIDFDTFAKLWPSVFIEENVVLRDILDLAPLPKFLLSNTNKLHHSRYNAGCSIVRRHFQSPLQQILSFREGAMTPSPDIYLAAIDRARVRFCEALFVDARPENISAWEELGGYGILYNAHKDTIENLTQKLELFDVLR